jgi:flagellar hook assembly protein FlgD
MLIVALFGRVWIMSHQPSTMDNVRSAASAATHAVAETIDPEAKVSGAKDKDSSAKDSQGQTIDKGSYKDQLNDAAYGNLEPKKEDETMVEKGTIVGAPWAIVTSRSGLIGA